MKTTIAKRLNELNKTCVWLSEQTGIHVNTIRKWRNGLDAPASYNSMVLIADALRVRVSAIWPNVHDVMDWEHRYNVVTEHLENIHYKDQEFLQLCRERAAASVHCYIAGRNKMFQDYLKSDGADKGGYCQFYNVDQYLPTSIFN